MRKKMFFVFAFLIILPVSSVWAFKSDEKISTDTVCSQNENCSCKKEQNECKDSFCEENVEKYKKTCDKCEIEDDEYCVYNQCYFDKHYRKMKKYLCLTPEQEECIDNLYKSFKIDMEALYLKNQNSKNKLLNLIECEHKCYKEQKRIVQDLKDEFKAKLSDYNDEVKQSLRKEQKTRYSKFIRYEKRKMKKIIKYSAIYKLPCVDCCKLK